VADLLRNELRALVLATPLSGASDELARMALRVVNAEAYPARTASVWKRLLDNGAATNPALLAGALNSPDAAVLELAWSSGHATVEQATTALDDPTLPDHLKVTIALLYDVDPGRVSEALLPLSQDTVTALERVWDTKNLGAVPAGVWVEYTRAVQAPDSSRRARELGLWVCTTEPVAPAAAADTRLAWRHRLLGGRHQATPSALVTRLLREYCAEGESGAPSDDWLDGLPSLVGIGDRQVLTDEQEDLLYRSADCAAGSSTSQVVRERLDFRRDMGMGVSAAVRQAQQCRTTEDLTAFVSRMDNPTCRREAVTDAVLESPACDLSLVHALAHLTGYRPEALAARATNAAAFWHDLTFGARMLTTADAATAALALGSSGRATAFTAAVAAGDVILEPMAWAAPVPWEGDLDAVAARVPVRAALDPAQVTAVLTRPVAEAIAQVLALPHGSALAAFATDYEVTMLQARQTIGHTQVSATPPAGRD
jgi:hypothetical protein